MIGCISAQLLADRCPYPAPCSVTTHQVSGTHFNFLSLTRLVGVAQCDANRILTNLVTINGHYFKVVVRLEPSTGNLHRIE
ncbi:hypothetical protein D3C87_1566550 [compost metagenome]